MAMDNGMPVENQAAENQEVSVEDLLWALGRARGLLEGCSVRPETPEDHPELRTEWRRGSVAPNVYCNATSGTAEQFALKLWQYTLK